MESVPELGSRPILEILRKLLVSFAKAMVPAFKTDGATSESEVSDENYDSDQDDEYYMTDDDDHVAGIVMPSVQSGIDTSVLLR